MVSGIQLGQTIRYAIEITYGISRGIGWDLSPHTAYSRGGWGLTLASVEIRSSEPGVFTVHGKMAGFSRRISALPASQWSVIPVEPSTHGLVTVVIFVPIFVPIVVLIFVVILIGKDKDRDKDRDNDGQAIRNHKSASTRLKTVNFEPVL